MKRLTHRMLALLLPFALLLVTGTRAAEEGEYGGSPDAAVQIALADTVLPRTRAYDGRFADVSEDDWFYGYAVSGYEYGLFNGQAPDRFGPEKDITVAELLTLSARLRAASAGDTIPEAEADEPWYQPYVAYLDDRGLLDAALTEYDVPATRAQLAGIFALSLPEDRYSGLNADLITDAYASGGFITDVDEYTPYQQQILWLYRQGLLTGTDSSGSYRPDRSTTRAEAAAVVMRMVDPAMRITLNWTVLSYRSAAGATLSGLVEAPDAVNSAPDVDDAGAIDALVRQMLAAGGNQITLHYDGPLGYDESAALVHAFNVSVKSYCEQMYNAAKCQSYTDGTVELTFSVTACTDEQLVRLRAETLAEAIRIHDELWEAGYLTRDMSEYEIAHFYYIWLCEHCAYDYRSANSTTSLSHIAYSALLRGRAVCDGYTGAYNLLLKLEGIECTALPNDSHIWTVATLDGTEYHIDTTWGDQAGRVDMRYFGMTEEQSYAAHPW